MIYNLIFRFVFYIKLNFIPIILIILSIYDLRIDLRLLVDHFTFSSFIYLISDHPLALTVLTIVFGLFKKPQVD